MSEILIWSSHTSHASGQRPVPPQAVVRLLLRNEDEEGSDRVDGSDWRDKNNTPLNTWPARCGS
ncbi:MAG TPA: hypothetical protein EYQ84_05090 [Nitrospinaceae bacterium]|nr:hypothetical protein [Nitrospinaceae bacterium]